MFIGSFCSAINKWNIRLHFDEFNAINVMWLMQHNECNMIYAVYGLQYNECNIMFAI